MKIQSIKSNTERSILTGMIVNSIILSRIASKWGRRGNMFRSEWSNLVANWCIDYHRKYKVAPKKAIKAYFQEWSEKTKDKESQELVRKFLFKLSEDFVRIKKSINPEFVIDQAASHFTQVKLERLRDVIETHLEAGQVDKAARLASAFNKIELGTGAAINLFTDKDSVRQAFEKQQEALVKYPGAIGEFFGNALHRDGLVAFMGPEKRGKSYWILDLVWRAALQRRKTVLFVLGDMSEAQVQMRFGCRAARAPRFAGRPVMIPTMIKRPMERYGPPRVKFKTRQYKKGLSWQRAWHAYQETLKTQIKSEESYIKIVVLPAEGISVEGIEEQLQLWSQEGWTADVVAIDYADNLDMPYGFDVRQNIDQCWKGLRRIGQRFHCLVVTATQANAKSYDEKDSYVITRRNFSDNKKKLAHVTGMIGLNQTVEEKKVQSYRLNWVLERDGHFSEYKCVFVTGCLPLARPAMLSTW